MPIQKFKLRKLFESWICYYGGSDLNTRITSIVEVKFVNRNCPILSVSNEFFKSKFSNPLICILKFHDKLEGERVLCIENASSADEPNIFCEAKRSRKEARMSEHFQCKGPSRLRVQTANFEVTIY